MDAVVVGFEEAVHLGCFEVAAFEVSAAPGASLGCFGVGRAGAFLATEFEVGVSSYIGVDDGED